MEEEAEPLRPRPLFGVLRRLGGFGERPLTPPLGGCGLPFAERFSDGSMTALTVALQLRSHGDSQRIGKPHVFMNSWCRLLYSYD